MANLASGRRMALTAAEAVAYEADAIMALVREQNLPVLLMIERGGRRAFKQAFGQSAYAAEWPRNWPPLTDALLDALYDAVVARCAH